MKKLTFPAQAVQIDTPEGIDPVWYEKLKQIETVINNGLTGQGALATTATVGFGAMPTSSGPPTGVPFVPPTGLPNPRSGYVPFVFDTTNNKLWIYNGAWKGVVLT